MRSWLWRLVPPSYRLILRLPPGRPDKVRLEALRRKDRLQPVSAAVDEADEADNGAPISRLQDLHRVCLMVNPI